MLLLGNVEDRVGGIAPARERLSLHAAVGGDLRGCRQRLFDLFAGVDHPLHVCRSLCGLRLQLTGADRCECGHDRQLRSALLAQLHRALHRLGRGLRSVGADDNEVEHAQTSLMVPITIEISTQTVIATWVQNSVGGIAAMVPIRCSAAERLPRCGGRPPRLPARAARRGLHGSRGSTRPEPSRR